MGRSFFNDSVVMQKEAFVFLAMSLYFLEWKKVISELFAVSKSLISVIFRSEFNLSVFIFKSSVTSKTDNGP